MGSCSRIRIDTSAIYALLDRSDANHARAVALLKKMRDAGDTIVIANLAETHALVLSKRGYSVARSWLQGQCWPVERVTSADEEKAVEVLCSYEDKTFSYTDATTFAVVERLGIRTALGPESMTATRNTVLSALSWRKVYLRIRVST